MTKTSQNISKQGIEDYVNTTFAALRELQELTALITRNDEKKVLDLIRLIAIWHAVPVTISLKTTRKVKKLWKNGKKRN